MATRQYSLNKSRHIMTAAYAWYKKKRHILDKNSLGTFENDLEKLDQALLSENRQNADEYARKVDTFCNTHFKKSFWAYATELVMALVLALAVAVVVRSMWFEPYEIPTGSMRPTFREQDHLTVTKLAFGINMPLETKHFYFDPNLVQRTSVAIFSGEHIPYIDQQTTYFGLIPYTKRYIKRLMGKPGDTVYFYGGKLYTIDKEGKPVTELLDSPWMKHLEHIPFLVFEGMVTAAGQQQLLFNQMHRGIGRMSLTANGEIEGEIFDGKRWIKDQPMAQSKPHNTMQTYSDFWGMRNYGMSRLLTKKQLMQDTTLDTAGLGNGVLYLEIRHTPSLGYPQRREQGGMVIPYATVIPLQKEHLGAILDNMYTARFIVKDGMARRYSVEDEKFPSKSPRFPKVPNGTYEFYNGKAYEVLWGGIIRELPADHPLNERSVGNAQQLYNIGIEMDMAFSPQDKRQRYFPQRYTYFRNGDLYLLGAPILKKGDPTLAAFAEREQKREQAATSAKPYVAFKDYGPPLKADGSYDKEFIQTFGITIPEKHYLMLGDNHAMSSDSRVFGFVPEDNLQGAPSLIIWPPGERWGFPMQKPYPLMNVPRAVVWSIALVIAAIWYAWHRRNMRKPIFKKLATTT